MPGKRPKGPRGFLTTADVVERAKARNLNINRKTLAKHAADGKVPHAVPIPKGKGLMFPEAKLDEVIAAASKTRVRAEGTYSTQEVIKMGKQQGLTLCLADIQNRIKRIEAGKEPWPDGLARDPYDLRKKWILPQSFVDSLLRDAIRRKLLPKMLEDRALIPLTELAREVGFAERSLHGRKDLETVKIGGKRFVARKEAERFKLRFPVGRKMTLVEEVKLFQRTAYDELKKLGDERIPIEQRRQLKAKLEKQMEEFDKRLETERAKAMLKKGPTKPDFFERNNLDIARARLEILSGLAEGRTVKDRAIKSLMKRIQELQELNEALSH